MSEATSVFLDSVRLLFDLQQGNAIARSLGGCLTAEAIAQRVTAGLVEKFSCTFARIWLVEPNRAELRLVASSGIYTNLNGSFARIKMGDFKVGKIAQHCIPFLSNNLPEEIWVKDRQWAIEHGIRGFAGYPLVSEGRAVGVLAVFSQQPMALEFLEVLQGLCTTVTIALENALQYQQEKQSWQGSQTSLQSPLSEQLVNILSPGRLTLIGTETPLTTPLNCIFLRATEILSQFPCIYCRLTYELDQISLEAMISLISTSKKNVLEATPDRAIESAFGDLLFAVSCLGGMLQISRGADRQIGQVLLSIPKLIGNPSSQTFPRLHLRISSRSSVLQMAFTHLAYLAGLNIDVSNNSEIALLTDDLEQVEPATSVLWIDTQGQGVPKIAKAKLDLSTNPEQLRAAVTAIYQGESWGMKLEGEQTILSEREQEIMALLTQGLRDRDIASQLFISESTVKFHMHNAQTKLKAKTRYMALHQAIINGWI